MDDGTVKVTKCYTPECMNCKAMQFGYEKGNASQGIQIETQEKEQKMKDVQLCAVSLHSSPVHFFCDANSNLNFL